MVLFLDQLPLPVVAVFHPIVRGIVPIVVAAIVRVRVDLRPQQVGPGNERLGQRGALLKTGVVALMALSLPGTAAEGVGGFFPRMLRAGKKSDLGA